MSTARTQLVWEGKYDEYGSPRQVPAAGQDMPLQRIETIDEPRSRSEAQGTLFDPGKAHLDDFRNMLIWGDNMLVTTSLLRDFRGRVSFIYIDPPFNVGADFTMSIPIGDGRDEVTKDQSVLEMVAYRDTWGLGTDSYLQMMYERLSLMRELLSDRGTLMLHCDSRMGHYLKLLLDEVFGTKAFVNEIVWHYTKYEMRGMSRLTANSDRLLWYARTPGEFTFNLPTIKLDKPRRLLKKGWDRQKRSIQNVKDSSGKVQYIYMDEKKVDDVWDISYIGAPSFERTGFATQKPEKLLDRIIGMCTTPTDLVGDFFCGSGTTGVVAERLGRRWIMADLGRFAIHVSRKRLIQEQRLHYELGESYRAFDVLNLGRYERQWWQEAHLHGADEEHRRVVLAFFRAEVLETPPSTLLHGRKGPLLCHVAPIDATLTREALATVVEAVAGTGAKDLACLAWEFEMDLRLVADDLQAQYGLRIKLIRIPREIMEKHRTNPPPFLEVAVLAAEPVAHESPTGTTYDIRITRFIPSLAEVPARELEALQERSLRSGFDFIDFWAVDFNYEPGQPFAHHWQDFRTKADRSLRIESEQQFEYERPGDYLACIKVIDIFGSDTSITVPIHVVE